MTRTLLFCTLLLLSAPALAIYRCEAEGKVGYSDKPCAGGRAIDVGTSVAPHDAAKASAQAVRDKARLAQLENERHRREAMEEKERQKAARASKAKENRCMALARRKKAADEDAAAATGKAHAKAMRRLRRMADDFEADCGK